MARPTLFNESLAEEICIRIACGDSLAKVCRDDEMPAYRTVMTWLRQNEAFRQNYVQARADKADADFDGVSDIGDRVLEGKIDPQAARVAIDAKKWAAARAKPKVYGDKVALVGGDKADAPIRHSHGFDLTKASDEELEVLERFITRRASDTGGDQGGESSPEG